MVFIKFTKNRFFFLLWEMEFLYFNPKSTRLIIFMLDSLFLFGFELFFNAESFISFWHEFFVYFFFIGFFSL